MYYISLKQSQNVLCPKVQNNLKKITTCNILVDKLVDETHFNLAHSLSFLGDHDEKVLTQKNAGSYSLYKPKRLTRGTTFFFKCSRRINTVCLDTCVRAPK